MHVRVCVDMSILACICPPSPVLQAHSTIVGFPGAEVSTRLSAQPHLVVHCGDG